MDNPSEGGLMIPEMAIDDIMPSPSRQSESASTESQHDTTQQPHDKTMDLEPDGPTSEMNSPVSVDSSKQDASIQQTVAVATATYVGGSPSSSHEFSSVRVRASN